MKALYFDHFGDNSVLQYGGDLPVPQITADEVLVKMKYIGLNFADIYRRKGNYHLEPHLPYINGYEGLGTIVKLGENVTELKCGERILFVDVPLANAELVAVPLTHVIKVPPEIDDKLAAAIGLQGLTADFLAHDLAQSQPGERAFIQGISGGVGQILLQMLTADGIQVSGVTSTRKKQELAFKQGASHVYLRTDQWAEQLCDTFATVFDGVGSTLKQSLALAKHKGQVVFFGMAGGNPTKVDPLALLEHSKSILTGDLWDYLSSRSERQSRFERLASYFISQKIVINEPPQCFPLSEGQKAYAFLESGSSNGKILMECR